MTYGFDRTMSPAGFREALARRNVFLPLIPHTRDVGVVIDSTGRDVFTVDSNGTREDAEALDIATLIAMAINTMAGVEAGALEENR